jgi:hypothetical protein
MEKLDVVDAGMTALSTQVTVCPVAEQIQPPPVPAVLET